MGQQFSATLAAVPLAYEGLAIGVLDALDAREGHGEVVRALHAKL
jgi:hypothetical protein